MKKVKDKSTLDLLPYRRYDKVNNLFVCGDGSCMDLLQIVTKDLKSASDDEIMRDNYMFMKLYRKYPDDLKLIATNFPTNTLVQQQYFEKKISKTRNKKYKEALINNLNILKWLDKNRTYRDFYIMFWGKDVDELVKNRDTILSILGSGKNKLVRPLADEKKTLILKKLNNKNVAINKSEIVTESIVDDIDINLLKETQPIGGINFRDETVMRTGDGYETCLHIMKYPSELEEFWLSNLTNQNNTIATIDISNEDITVVKKNINKSLKEQNQRYINASNYIDSVDAENKYNDMKDLLDEISGMNEVLKKVDARIFLSNRSWLKLDEEVSSLKAELENSKGFVAFSNLNETKSDWCSMYQSFTDQQKNKYAVDGQLLTSEAVAGGNPFHFSSLEDPCGSFFGTTKSGGNVLFDPFTKTLTRKFYNGLAIGTMGSGKSTLLKKLQKCRCTRGDFVRVFDISGEFSGITTEYGGKVVNLDGSDGTAINPLEILRAGDEDSVNFARHQGKLKTIYRFLVPSATDEELKLLNNCFYEFYDLLGLTPEAGRSIVSRNANEYPIFSDFYEYLMKKKEVIANDEYNDVDIVVAQHKLIMLENISDTVYGLITTYGNLFNRHTSLDNITEEMVLCFNLSKLKDMDSNVFDAQIFSIVSLCWDNAVMNGQIMYRELQQGKRSFDDVVRFTMLIDESHRWINANKLQALDLILIYAREARKYFAGILLASQNIRDYVPEGSSDVAVNKLKTLFELTQYKFIFQQDSNTLRVIEDVFGNSLTTAQINRIPLLEQGSCILSIASDVNLEFDIFITDEEEHLFGGGV